MRIEEIEKEIEKETDKLSDLKEEFCKNTAFKSVESIIIYLQSLKEKDNALYKIIEQERFLKEIYQNDLINVTKKLNKVTLELVELKIKTKTP